MEVSTPSHPRYGQHLKRDQVKALLKPRDESTDSVMKWLQESGVASENIINDGEWINFVTTVSAAETMLDTTFRIYQSLVRKDIQKIRALQYSVPTSVRDHIDLIQPTTRFGYIQPQRSLIIDKEEIASDGAAVDVNAACGTYITPQCLKDLYNFANYVPGKANVTIGVTGYLSEYARFKDFAQFTGLYAPWANGSAFSWTSVNGECSTLRV